MSTGYVIYPWYAFFNKRCTGLLYISAWAIFGVARSDWVGNAKAFVEWDERLVQIPALSFLSFIHSVRGVGRQVFGGKEMKLHVGQMIKEEVERQERPIA